MSTIMSNMFSLGKVLISFVSRFFHMFIVMFRSFSKEPIVYYKFLVNKELYDKYEEYLYYKQTPSSRKLLGRQLSKSEAEMKLNLIYDNFHDIKEQYKKIFLPFRLLVMKEYKYCVETSKSIKKMGDLCEK